MIIVERSCLFFFHGCGLLAENAIHSLLCSFQINVKKRLRFGSYCQHRTKRREDFFIISSPDMTGDFLLFFYLKCMQL